MSIRIKRIDLDTAPEWTGPVVRRDPASYQLPSIIRTWRCRGEFCGHWTAPRSFEPDRCDRCGTKREIARSA